MTTHATEAAAREQLRRISRDLEALRFRLLGVQASLPASPLEHDPLREDDAMDPAALAPGSAGEPPEGKVP